MTDVLARARDLFAAEAWGDASAAFSAADEERPLAPEDLERWAAGAQLVGEDELSASAWERAHVRFLEEGEVARAVRCAFWLAFGLLIRGEHARAGGWLARATRLLDDHRVECVERGLLLVPQGLRELEGGDPERAHEIFSDATAIARQYGDPDLMTLGRLGMGRSLVVMGRDAEGLPLLDEAMVSVTAKEVAPVVAGRVYCAVILVCQQAFDLERAHEWTAALSDWCASHPDMVPFRGQCLVHRSELMQWHGEWPQALREAERARDRLTDPPGQPSIGLAFYQLGELYRLRGDFADAEAAYREASRHGRLPQPGLSCLRWMQGDLSSAVGAVRRLLGEPGDRVGRARLLGAAVEIMAAAGELEAAAAASSELADIAATVGAPVLRAMALQAAGTLALERGDTRSALEAARGATDAWARLEAPYEQARAKVVAATACRDLGDRDTAELEADAARRTFEQLGARPDVNRVEALFPTPAQRHPGNLTDREIEVLVLVAAGKPNQEIAEALALSPHTVRRHLQNIFHKAGVTSRAAAVAFAFENGLI